MLSHPEPHCSGLQASQIFSHVLYVSGGMQVAGSLLESSLVVMLCRFDEGVNGQFDDDCCKRPQSSRSVANAAGPTSMRTS